MLRTESICSESLKNKLLSALKSNLWTQFMEAVGFEIDEMRDNISQNRDVFDVEKQYEDGLIRIAESFGYTPNLIIDNSLEMVKKEVESIPSRIRNKTTYDGYYIILKQIKKIGDIYNYYWSGNKLVKAVKWNNILNTLNNLRNYNKPFNSVTPDKNFSTIATADAIRLDSDVGLDDLVGQWNWQLDENMEISPTKHLGIEYYVRNCTDFGSDEDYLIVSEYFQYLSEGVEYNRRIPIVPHVGIQISGITSETGSYDYFNETYDYSCPDIKLKCATAFEYTKSLVVDNGFTLDNSDGTKLDELITWKLDKEIDTGNRVDLNSFKYISCGNGRLTIPDEKHSLVFDYHKMILCYTYGDDDTSMTIKDYSLNEHNGTIIGEETKKIKGIIGKSVNFEGSTAIGIDDPISLTKANLSVGTWYMATSEALYEARNGLKRYILDFGFITVSYSYRNEKAYWTFGGVLSGEVPASYNTAHQITFTINDDEDVLTVYSDGVLSSTHDISDIDWANEYDLYIGCYGGVRNFFVGKIDSTWVENKILSASDVEYIFTNKQGVLTHLANKMAEYELDIQHEGYEDDDWFVIQSHVKANDVSEEFAFYALESLTQTEEYVDVFYNGKTIKKNITDDMSSADKYCDFEFVQFTAYQKGNTYLFSDDEGVTFYMDYEVNDGTVTLLDKYEGSTEGFESTGYDFYTNVTYIQSSLEQQTYSGKTNFAPIENEYFSLIYKKLAPNGIDYIDVELRANQEGNFYNAETNENVTGKLNYTTGAYELNSLTERYVTQEALVNTLSDPKRVICNLKGSPSVVGVEDTSEVKPRTLVVTYRMGDNIYNAHDNGEGMVSGIGITNGSINYSDRLISITFDQNYTGDILVSYTYYEDLGMVEGTPIVFNYKIENEPVTEIGLENENHELLAYMTFPKVQFDTINNHISALFAIRKLNSES